MNATKAIFVINILIIAIIIIAIVVLRTPLAMLGLLLLQPMYHAADTQDYDDDEAEKDPIGFIHS